MKLSWYKDEAGVIKVGMNIINSGSKCMWSMKNYLQLYRKITLFFGILCGNLSQKIDGFVDNELKLHVR